MIITALCFLTCLMVISARVDDDEDTDGDIYAVKCCNGSKNNTCCLTKHYTMGHATGTNRKCFEYQNTLHKNEIVCWGLNPRYIILGKDLRPKEVRDSKLVLDLPILTSKNINPAWKIIYKKDIGQFENQ